MALDITSKEIEQRCAAALKDIGFRTTSGTAYCPINETVLGWVGLNIAKHRDFVRINPNIGVHCVPVMRCMDSIRGKKYQPGRIATLAEPLGVIMPGERQIVMTDRTEIEPEIDRLMSYIVSDAKDRIAHLADLSVLESALHRRVPQFGGAPEMYALTLLLNGKTDEFTHFVSQQTVTVGQLGEPGMLADWNDFKGKAQGCLLDLR